MGHGLKILSGGQTGADRAALDAALDCGVPCGGWCPAGRRAEDGAVPPRYPLAELSTDSYPARTRKNAAESDATVAFSYGPPTGGTKLTVDLCRRWGKPCLVVDADLSTAGEAAVLLAVFLLRHRVAVLNVAGPRASGQPAVGAFVYDALVRLFRPTRWRRTAARVRPRTA